MGFKADTSFLRFLTMGAVGVQATLATMRDQGFEPVELERCSTSNKIWATKVKRLRLPDLLCVRTGARVEVRAKSELRVRMSDAPSNPERRWDVGLRDEDLVAFVACAVRDSGVEAIGQPAFFLVSDLRASLGATRLGPPKSAAEGAERDREWPCTVPSKSGRVVELNPDKIIATLVSRRRQSYQLKGKRPYVHVGEVFTGGASIVAGIVPRLAPVAELLSRQWDCRSALAAPGPTDRYTAAKAIPHIQGAEEWGIQLLERAVTNEIDERVALEIAASAARLGAPFGIERISSVIWGHPRADLKMEGVLILSEVATAHAFEELRRIASAAEFARSEIRQAAVWGLGRAGARAYRYLADFTADEDNAVALHAIAAFGSDTPVEVIEAMIARLLTGTPRERAAASAVLRVIGSAKALAATVQAAKQTGAMPRPWLIATLGRFPAARVREVLAGEPLLSQVEPLLVSGADENWLARPLVGADLDFLLAQNL